MKTFSRCTVVLLAFALSSAIAQEAPQNQSGANGRRQTGEVRRGTFGEIAEISGPTLKIKLPDGSLGTVTTTGDTRFRKERQDAKLSDFKVGDTIMVRGEASGEKAWSAQVISSAPSQGEMRARMKDAMGKTMILGEVKSIDPPKLTIHRQDGVDQTIEADENTSFRKGRGESITLPDIKVGDMVFARGESKDGVFAPEAINVLSPEMAQRLKEGGGMFIMGGGDSARRGPQSHPSAPPK